MLIFYYALQIYNFCVISIEMEEQSLYETELKISTEKYLLIHLDTAQCANVI